MIKQHYIFFDLDGTLYDSKKDILDSWSNTYKKFNIKNVIPTIGPTIQEILSNLNGNYNIEEIQKYFIDQYDYSKLNNTRLYEGIYHFLKTLKSIGYSINILTNKRTIPTMTLLNRDQITDWFDVILTSDIKGKIINKKILLKEYLEHYNIDSKKCILFGDTQNDIETAKYNNCSIIHCKWGYEKINNNEIKSIDLDDLNNLI